MLRNLVSPATLALVLSISLGGPADASDGDKGPAQSIDDELVRMGREIPGFGGLYYDEQGRPNVYLLDPSGAGGTALKALGAEVRVHRGDFEFERLLDWRQQLRPLLSLPGVVFLDVDEARNRIVIGVDSSPQGNLNHDRLEHEILTTGVPRLAILLKETGHAEPLIGLQDKLRPVPGGAQIVFSSFICTLGFNAFRGRDFGFVTNSHCTDVFGEVEGTRYSQNVPASGSIGTETADPGFSSDPPCPVGKRCRFSDSAFAKYDNPRLGGLGKIARPMSSGSEVGSTTLKDPSARFTLTGRTGSPLAGDVVQKVGRTTGWTYGSVVGTCVDINETSDITLFCQSMVQIGGGPGDSGAPVFFRLPGNKARLVGILWGGAVDPDLGIVGIFSPLANIEADLGPLKVN